MPFYLVFVPPSLFLFFANLGFFQLRLRHVVHNKAAQVFLVVEEYLRLLLLVFRFRLFLLDGSRRVFRFVVDGLVVAQMNQKGVDVVGFRQRLSVMDPDGILCLQIAISDLVVYRAFKCDIDPLSVDYGRFYFEVILL